jgi:hypothetical protein
MNGVIWLDNTSPHTDLLDLFTTKLPPLSRNMMHPKGKESLKHEVMQEVLMSGFDSSQRHFMNRVSTVSLWKKYLAKVGITDMGSEYLCPEN